MRSFEEAHTAMARRFRRIRVGDLVQVTAGADRGKQGKVIAVDAGRGRVRVEKVRMQKHHVKPGRKIARSGGIIEQEGYIDASNVMLVDAESGRPSRLGVELDDQGKRVRVFRKSGARVPSPAGS
jgi:large subunit ribosomal protein L24